MRLSCYTKQYRASLYDIAGINLFQWPDNQFQWKLCLLGSLKKYFPGSVSGLCKRHVSLSPYSWSSYHRWEIVLYCWLQLMSTTSLNHPETVMKLGSKSMDQTKIHNERLKITSPVSRYLMTSFRQHTAMEPEQSFLKVLVLQALTMQSSIVTLRVNAVTLMRHRSEYGILCVSQ